MIVVSDTSPICYLLLIGKIDILPSLYGEILIPQIVRDELANTNSPLVIQEWIQSPPNWLQISNVSTDRSSSPGVKDLNALDPGEVAAILLAQQRSANLLLVDDLLGRRVAKSLGIEVTGLIGVLDAAAQRGQVNLPDVIGKLQKTSFRISSELVQSLLDKYE